MAAAVESMHAETDRRVQEKLRREFGIVGEYLTATDVIEIVLNPDGRLWVERLGREFECVGAMAPSQAETLMMTIAAYHKTTITRDCPILECELPFDGSRFQGLIAPVVAGPTFAIRRRASRVFTLDEYVQSGAMTARQAEIIRTAVDRHENILIVGGTGTGKTTLANAIIEYMARAFAAERLVIIEDTVELQTTSPNVVALRSSDTVTMVRLLRCTLRLRPDRILVGETRGGEAHALLKAWNTGHPGGLTTIHADDAPSGLLRLEELVAEATPAPQHRSIARAVGIVVHIARTATGRQVQEIVSVDGHDGTSYVTHRKD